MTPQLAKNLNKARDTIINLDCILSANKYRNDLPTALVSGLLKSIIQYHRSILLLINSGYVRSAAALARDVADNTYTALWINACASSDQIGKVKTDGRFPVTYPEIFEQVDSKYNENAFFADLKNQCGALLYSYNRTGILKVGVWWLDSSVELHHDEHELSHVTSAVTLCVLFLASEFLANQDQPAESKIVQALANDYEKHCALHSLSLHKSA